MFAILLFSLLVIASAQTTTLWTGASSTGSPNWSDVNNWSNGVPTATSIVQISDTTCNTSSNCYPTVDGVQTVAELHVGAVTFSIYLTIVGNLTVTSKAVFGTSSTTANYAAVYVYFDNGNLTTTSGCNTTVYYTTYDWFYAENTYTGLWWNYGNVWVFSNGGLTAGNAYNVRFGYDLGQLTIVNWGNWVVTDPQVYVTFYYLASYQHWSGNYNSTWTSETTPEPTIQWYDSDCWILSSSFASSGPIEFYSDYQNTETGYSSSTPPAVVEFGATGITIENAIFEGVNILFNNDGTLYNCNFTNNAFINSTSATTATISGNSYFIGNTYLSCLTSGVTFQVVVDQPSTLTLQGYFGLFGTVVLANSGTFILDSNDEIYFDAVAFWINLGLMRVINYSNDWILGSSFGLSTPTTVGTMINMGTIQFESLGGLYWEAGTGTFYQTDSGVMKYIFGVGSDPYYPRFADIALDGYIGIYFASGYTTSSSYTLFTWKASDYTSAPQNMWTGDLTVSTNDNAHTIPSPQQSCYDPTGGYAYLYPISGGLCSSQSSTYVTFSNPSPTGGVTSAITNPPAAVTALLASTPPCGAHSTNTGCGQSVGISANQPGKSSGSIIPVSISFLMSCLAYLYFSTF